MNSRSTARCVTMGAVVALSVATVAGPAMAQVQQPAPPYGTAPGTAPRPTSPSMSPAEKARPAQVEGTVKKVDPGAQTVDISSGLFGMMGRRLEVNDRTTIQLDGRQATLADIREGTKVKASYEAQDGKNVAMAIEVIPPARTDAGSPPASRSGTKQ
jgi:colicin import membrane protein